METTATHALEAFSVQGDLQELSRLGEGHIHHTSCARVQGPEGARDYVLQRVNQEVFPDVPAVMENMLRVTRHLRTRIVERGGDPTREALEVLTTPEGHPFFLDPEGGYWRCFPRISRAVCHQTCQDPSLLEQASAAFGRFQCDLSDLPGGPLLETIPGFHDSPARYLRFEEVLEEAPASRLTRAEDAVDFLQEREFDLDVVQRGLEAGHLPQRTCHNDTKLNNVLFDQDSGEALCVIDLDTVMTGSALHDFGDAVRSAASTTAEDDPELDRVDLDLVRYEAMLRGYLREAGESLAIEEVRLLPFAPRLLGLELGMRFLTDYLEGDRYFPVEREDQNLDRCRNQFALVRAMEARAEAMEEALERCWRG